jgi:taurine transport system permease protein
VGYGPGMARVNLRLRGVRAADGWHRALWRRRVVDVGFLALSLVLLLGIWEAGIVVAGLNPVVLPAPSRVWRAATGLLVPTPGHGPVLLTDVGASLARLMASVVLGVLAGVAVGLAAGMNRHAYRVCYPLVNALIPVPPYAWIPILVLWLGPSNLTIVVATALSASLPLVYNTMAGVRGVDRRQVWVLQTFGSDLGDIIRLAVLPAVLASILSGLRLSIGQAWRTLIGGEFLVLPSAGLGSLIFNARQFLAVDTMFVGIIALGVLGFGLIYWAVGLIEERTVVQWGVLERR